MQHYCGLDVSLNKTSICVVDHAGNIVSEGDAPSEPQAIHEWLCRRHLCIERIGIEAGATGPWLCKELRKMDWPVICIETRHAKAALAAQQVKTDRNDARGIAHIMRTGWYRAVHVKSDESQRLRVLLNSRKCLLEKRKDIELQIRGTIRAFGLKVGRSARGGFETRVLELVAECEELKVYLLPMLRVRQEMMSECSTLDKMILKYVRSDDVCRRLMTIPGVGPLTALAFKTFVDTPLRFSKARSIGAAVGLTPRKYASGEVDIVGSITKCGDPFVRMHLYEGAQSLLTRTRKSTALKRWGLKLAKRSSMKNACVAVARRLAVMMLAIWRDGTVFVDAEETVSTAAA